MRDPRVSLITPCYNAERYIGQTIESVKAQTIQSWEQIVVDDGSTDQSLSVIESCMSGEPRIKLMKQSNAGMLTARVNAYRHVHPNSEYLLFLDADDLIKPRMLERLIAYLDSHLDVGIAHCKFDFIGPTGQLVVEEDRLFDRYVASGSYMRALPDSEPRTPSEALCWWSSLTPSATLIRRSSYDEVGGWDEPLRYGHEDADLFMRVALNHPVHFVPEDLASYRLHPEQMTKKHLLLQKDHLQFHKKWLTGAHLSEIDRKQFRRTWFLYEGWLVPQFWARRSLLKLASGDVLGAMVCFGRIWKHLAMVATAPAREILW